MITRLTVTILNCISSVTQSCPTLCDPMNRSTPGLPAEYIMGNAKLNEAQAGIKIARRNINNLRYADNITLWQKAKRNQRASG